MIPVHTFQLSFVFDHTMTLHFSEDELFWGGGGSDFSIRRIGAVQLSDRVVVWWYTFPVSLFPYTALPKEPVLMPLIYVFFFFFADLYAAVGKESTPHPLHAYGKL